jgi:hypothetical protein
VDSRYTDCDAHRFREEHDATRHELEIISKHVGIAEIEWQHQRKQLLEAIDGESCKLLNFNLILRNTNCRLSVIPADRDAELNRLKALAEKLANKVNSLRDTPEARLGAVVGRVDEVGLHGIHLGTALGLAAMSTRTGNLSSSRIRTNFLPLGAESTENPHSRTMNIVLLEKSKENPPSFGILINARRPVMTPDAFPLLIK